MKKILFILCCSVIMSFNAQQKDLLKTTKITQFTDTINGEIINRSVKLVTVKEQPIKLDPDDKSQTNQDRIFPPTEVVKTFYINNDDDADFDKVYKLTYYEKNGRIYDFKSDDNRYSANTMYDNKMTWKDRNVEENLSLPYYTIEETGFNGYGYFDENNNFIIEHFDENTNQFTLIEFSEK